MTRNLDLTPYCQNEAIVLSGRPKGVEVRADFKLDELDASPDEAIIAIPEQIISLNGSFFLGLFAPSVKSLGTEGFDRKYRFECREELRIDINRGKKEALNESNPLK